ncbi:synaptopodin-2-like isoform X1 [Electrophorus electricus]|uniref:synaptopodin-2-like isoform X1 n=1 Tax=Electrophorus electricus TaxID=8005 RepID=UPI0015CF9E35|nr:synaptopodin-2-like isoform X1 [Electrophorus electricus]
MGTGDYVCITVRGRAPWGFLLRQSDAEPHHPLQVYQVETNSHASLAGLCENDELLSVNGEPCSTLNLSEAIALIEDSTDCLQLLVKRCCSHPQESYQSVSPTLQIPSPYQDSREIYISESQDEAYYGETDSEAECPGGAPMVRTQFCITAPKDKVGPDSVEGGDPKLAITPGSMVELQLSLSKTTLEDTHCASLGCARGVEGVFHHKTNNENDNSGAPSDPGCSFFIPRHDRKPLAQRGVLVSSPCALQGQVEVVVQSSGRGSGTERVGACGAEEGTSERLDSSEGEGGQTEEAHVTTVSFGIASEEGDSESEREQSKPNKHRARHARLRRSESLSEKQVKEAKSKCKRIALLLTAAAPNPNNKGLLMFKKHRQRAKQYTIVSYGTGDNEPEFEDEEAEEDNRETHAVEVTVLATSEAELDEDFFTNPPGHKSIVTFDWDTGLLEIERKINSKEDMNTLPETKGKGALMFAQRRQRMDEIAAEHEEMRRKGIPVEGVQEVENHYQQVEPQSYIQAAESQNYMDVNAPHPHQHQHYQQYQEQYYQHQQQQQYEEYHQHMQYQQQQEYQQQQYRQHQPYQEQQQLQQSSHHLNGMSSHQTTVTQSSVMNRSAKPFSVENRAAAPFTPSANQEQSSYSVGQGEQIASRDERISVPAIKTGVLQDKRRNKAKPMFTFKEPPKVSPNPELLNLLNRGDRKAGFESGPEEDYLSLGAEACNFLQSPKSKHKIPPPVAPKPHINPASPPWSPQPEIASQQFPQHAENNVPATAGVPGPEADPAPNIESSAIPEQEPSPTPAPERQEALTKSPSQQQQETINAWGTSEPQIQPDQQPETWHVNQSQQQMNNPIQPPQAHAKPDPSVSSWGPSPTQAQQQPPMSAWGLSEVQSQPHAQSQMQPVWVKQPQVISDVQPSTIIQTKSQSQPLWVTQSPPQALNPPQPQPQINSWATAQTQSPPQPPWTQSQMPTQPPVSTWSQDLNQTQGEVPWSHQQQQSQQLPSWTGPQQSPQNPWAQPQSQPQPLALNQHQAPTKPPVSAWTQPQSPVQAQPPWVQQAHPPPQSPPQMQQSQGPWPPQSQWAQQPHEHPQQMMNSWVPEQNQMQPPWTQPQLPAQTQPSWSQQPQRQAPPPSQTQTLLSAWTPRPQQGPVSITSPAETQKMPQPVKPWSPPKNTHPTPPQRMHSYTVGTKLPSPSPMSNTASLSGMGSAFEMPALRGKGAELFAKRQSRMEKYVVDSASVQANKARPSSPSPSLPTSWKYSTTCRAPPPLTYNPIQSPSYPPGAIKQPPSSSPSLKNKNKGKEKDKPAPKPLHVLDVMKHQPYQLNASLFTYGPAAEKLAAEKEAAEKFAAQKAAEAQAQAQAQAQTHIQAGGPANLNQHLSYDQSPASYGFIPQHPQPPQLHYGMSGPSTAMHDDPYHHTPPNNYQPCPNPYQQAPYQQIYSPQQVYQQSPSSPYQQASRSPYQQPPPYEAGPSAPYSAVLTPCYQPASSSYVVHTFPVAARADSTSGSSILTAPKPKFSANKSAAQVWKPSAPERVEK